MALVGGKIQIRTIYHLQWNQIPSIEKDTSPKIEVSFLGKCLLAKE